MELNQRISLTAPKGTIATAGIEAIMSLVAAQQPQQGEWKILNPDYPQWFLPRLPDDWQWVWTIQRGTYAGTMPKRVSSYYHKVHKLKCPPDFLREIGNIARQHSETNAAYNFEFVDHFDWQAGDYGDGGSCFWGSRESARDIMRENGGLAVRFYNPEGKGIARAWVQPIADDLHLVWNGYGFPGDATLTIARIVALHLNASYKRIEVRNNHVDSGVLYINGGRGFLIGAPDVLDRYNSYDFHRDTSDHECERCGHPLTDDDYYLTPDGEHYCEDCYYDNYDTCEFCSETRPREEITYLDSIRQYICEDCLDRHFIQCQECDGHFRPDDIEYHDDMPYCLSCYNRLEVDKPDESE